MPGPWRSPTTWARSGLVALGYVVGGRIGLAFTLGHDVASPVWPPAGLAMAAVALWGIEMLPAVAVATAATEAATGLPLPWTLLVAFGTCAEAALGGLLLRRAGGTAAFRRIAQLPTALVATFLGPIPAAACGAAALLGAGFIAAPDAAQSGLTWFLGDVAGALVVAPAALFAAESLRQPLAHVSLRRAVEAAAAVVLLGATALAVFVADVPLAYLYVAPLVWMALRFGPGATMGGLVSLDAFAVWATRQGLGPYAGHPPMAALLLLQGFVTGLAVVCLAVAALAAERLATLADLESRIRTRTARLAEANAALASEVRERAAAERQSAEVQTLARIASWSWDPAADRVGWSPELERVMGRPPPRDGGLAGSLAFVHAADRDRVRGILEGALKAPGAFGFDLRVEAGDGLRHLRVEGHAERGNDGQVRRLAGFAQDVTERHAAEDREREVRRLQEQAEFKTRFLRTAAHELGTPLTPLVLQMRILRGLAHTDAERRTVGILDRNIHRLQFLVHDLLESARLQSGRLVLRRRPTDLAHVVHDVVESFQEQAIQSGIRLDTGGPASLRLEADPDRIGQVLYNLLSNALKFTGVGGSIHVDLAPADAWAELTVRDTGLGFAPERAGQLFLPFSQVHDATTVVQAGSGLGLYICRGIVEEHGGTLRAWSAGIGHGATFTVELPMDAAPAATPVATSRESVAVPPVH